MALSLDSSNWVLLVTCTVAVGVGLYEMAAVRASSRATVAHYTKLLDQSVQHLQELVRLQQETNALLRERKAGAERSPVDTVGAARLGGGAFSGVPSDGVTSDAASGP
jgi:hypothetical protein